jgi:flagellar hook assembly protein FlgD
MKKISVITALILFLATGLAFAKIKVYPNPWVPSDKSGKQSSLFVTFENLTPGSKVQIYNVSGQLVATVNPLASDPTTALWYGKNNTSEPVASGVYTWVVNTGGTKTGKIVVVK